MVQIRPGTNENIQKGKPTITHTPHKNFPPFQSETSRTTTKPNTSPTTPYPRKTVPSTTHSRDARSRPSTHTWPRIPLTHQRAPSCSTARLRPPHAPPLSSFVYPGQLIRRPRRDCWGAVLFALFPAVFKVFRRCEYCAFGPSAFTYELKRDGFLWDGGIIDFSRGNENLSLGPVWDIRSFECGRNFVSWTLFQYVSLT